MNKIILVAATLLALSVLSSRSASAQSAQNYWSQTGAQCNVDDSSTANALYSRTSGSIKFAPGKTGTIGMFCSISKNTSAANPNQIWLSYQDTDLYSSNATKVTARLFGMSRQTGAIFQIGTDITSSSPAGAPSAFDNYTFQYIGHTFNFEANYYFYYVELTRASTSQQAILYGVALSYNQ